MSACLWDEVAQLPIIEEMVEQSITRGIHAYLLGEKRLEQKLDSLKENMKSEHSLRELSDPGIQVVDTFYHRIEGYHIAGNLLIFASDYQSLKKDSNRLFYIQQDKFRPVNKILKAYDFVKNRNVAQKTSILSEKEGALFLSTTKSIRYYATIIVPLCRHSKMTVLRSNSSCRKSSTCSISWKWNIRRFQNGRLHIRKNIFS